MARELEQTISRDQLADYLNVGHYKIGAAGSSARVRANVAVKRLASKSEKISGGRSLITLW